MNQKAFLPDTLQQALSLFLRYPDAVPVAGGTDLCVKPAAAADTRPWIYLGALPELHFLRETEESVEIGSCTPLSEIEHSDLISKYCPLLQKAVQQMASLQIRNRGTIGGNIMNASPAGDALTALTALRATVILCGTEGDSVYERMVSLQEFVIGPGKTGRKPGELLKSILIEKQPGTGIYEKVGSRNAMAISIASVAVQSHSAAGQPPLSIAIGSCAPVIVTSDEAEQKIHPQMNKEEIEEICDLYENALSPLSDLRASAAYRKEVVRSLLRHILKAYTENCL